MDNSTCHSGNGLIFAMLAAIVLPVVAAVGTGLWVLTAIPLGLLFGFFLQKGDLCGASAFSEILLMKDWRKVWGIWVCIVTGMVGFAILDALGWIALNPKPLIWANYVVGGVLFGVGMVLAGGCVSGCLFKAGSGNLNSIVALLGIALGVSFIEHGPLRGMHAYLKTLVVKNSQDGAVTLSSLTGVPYWALAVAFAVATVIAALLLFKRKSQPDAKSSAEFSFRKSLSARSWKPWQAGLLIGVVGCIAYLSSAASGRNYPLGVTHGVMHVELLITDHNLNHVYRKPAPKPPESPAPKQETPQKKVVWWLILLVTGLVAGSWVSGRLSGEARLLPRPPEQIVIALLGGLLVGSGAAIATGCVIGNITSGWALMSVGNILFAVVVVLANWATTYFYLMGGSIRDLLPEGKR